MKIYFLLIIVLLFAIFISSCLDENSKNNKATSPISEQNISMESTNDIAKLPIHTETQILEIKTAKFDFDISLGDFKVIEAGKHFMYDTDMIALDLTVITTCISGQYKYTSTVTPGFDGGIPVLILPDGSEIKHDPVDVSPAYDKVDIKKGDKTERFWRFMLPADFIPGEYDIRVDLENGQTKIFENVLIEFNE